MDRGENIMDIGSGFGDDAADHIEQRAHDYCACERDRIALSNEPRINELRAEGLSLQKLERTLDEHLRSLPPPCDVKQRTRSIIFHWATGIVLAAAAFVFSLIAFDPFRLGSKAYLYCLGIALVTPFATEKFLEIWKGERLLRGIVVMLFLAALIGGGLLAVIRGDLFSREIDHASPAIVIDGEPRAESPSQNNFYEETSAMLKALMVLLTVAIDLGAGIAIHRALELGAMAPEDQDAARCQLTETRKRLGEIIFEITALENGPAIFEKRFWRDYYRAMITQTVRNALGKMTVVALCLFLIGAGRVAAQTKVNLIIALDLSFSETVKSHDGRTQFAKNVDGVERILATVSAGTKITIVGITENSFGDPDVILSAQVSDDPGYFSEKLSTARKQLCAGWKKRSAQLAPRARQTDILGALLLASEMFRLEHAIRNVLVVISDMKNSTLQLDMEKRQSRSVIKLIERIQRGKVLADLTDVDVFVEGAVAAPNLRTEWEWDRDLWLEYFEKSRARVRSYSGLIGSAAVGIGP